MSKPFPGLLVGLCLVLAAGATPAAQNGGAGAPAAPRAAVPGGTPSSEPSKAEEVPAQKGLAMSDEILRDVAKLRGLTVRHTVPSGLKSRADIQKLVLADMAESTTPHKFADTTALLRFLGLVPADFELQRETTALLTEQIAGFYEPKTQFFYLADWIPLDEQRVVMAHELTHALADQHFDFKRFEKWPDGDSDAELAAHALIEGEATAVMVQYGLGQNGLSVDLAALPVSLTDFFRGSIDEPDPEHPVFTKAPDVMRQSLQFPYVYGVGFVQALVRSGTWRRVDQAYAKLPASTEQIMHPEKYLEDERPTKVAIPDVAGLLGTGWRLADRDVNGEFGYFLILKNALPEQTASKAAEGWAGDQYAYYRDESGAKSTLIHLTVWDSAVDAQEFFAAYSQRVERRFGVQAQTSADVHEWKTQEGLVRVELQGTRVVVIEGLRTASTAPVVARLMGKS